MAALKHIEYRAPYISGTFNALTERLWNINGRLSGLEVSQSDVTVTVRPGAWILRGLAVEETEAFDVTLDAAARANQAAASPEDPLVLYAFTADEKEDTPVQYGFNLKSALDFQTVCPVAYYAGPDSGWLAYPGRAVSELLTAGLFGMDHDEITGNHALIRQSLNGLVRRMGSDGAAPLREYSDIPGAGKYALIYNTHWDPDAAAFTGRDTADICCALILRNSGGLQFHFAPSAAAGAEPGFDFDSPALEIDEEGKVDGVRISDLPSSAGASIIGFDPSETSIVTSDDVQGAVEELDSSAEDLRSTVEYLEVEQEPGLYVRNGGFERWEQDGTPTHWTANGLSMTELRAGAPDIVPWWGRYCLRIKSDGTAAGGIEQVMQDAGFLAGKRLYISFFAVTLQNTGPSLRVRAVYGAEEAVNEVITFAAAQAGRWTPYKIFVDLGSRNEESSFEIHFEPVDAADIVFIDGVGMSDNVEVGYLNYPLNRLRFLGTTTTYGENLVIPAYSAPGGIFIMACCELQNEGDHTDSSFEVRDQDELAVGPRVKMDQRGHDADNEHRAMHSMHAFFWPAGKAPPGSSERLVRTYDPTRDVVLRIAGSRTSNPKIITAFGI